MPPQPIELRLLHPDLAAPLAEFFQALAERGENRWFHPHPLTAEEAYRLAHYSGQDLYYVLLKGRVVLGYGMLRGWDEGYRVPSLGLAIHPDFQGQGAGRLLVKFLHLVAYHRGARRVRLKFDPDNHRARPLYESLGYIIQGEEKGQILAFFDLAKSLTSPGDNG